MWKPLSNVRCVVLFLVTLAAPLAAETVLTTVPSIETMNTETNQVDAASLAEEQSRGDDPCGGGTSKLPPDMPGWPFELTTWRPTDGGLFVQADEDDDLEVLFASNRSSKIVYLKNPDGSDLPGWPKVLPNGFFARWGVSFGDVDGDGAGEVVATSDNQPNGGSGWTYAYRTDGTLLPGFPVITGGDHLRPPTVVDLDGDGAAEIIVSERAIGGAGSKVHVFDGSGNSLPGWPYVLPTYPASSAGAGDVDGDPEKEIVFPAYDALYVMNLDGSLVPGFPYVFPEGRTIAHSSPVLADVTGDGLAEIAIGTSRIGTAPRGSVYLFRSDGTVLPGWPIDLPYSVNSPPTFADLDGDQVPEIIVGENKATICPGGYIYAWDRFGNAIDGFPHGPVHGVQAQVAVGDIDGDGLPELIWDDSLTADGVGWLNGCHADGSPIEGWPLKFFGTPVFNTVALADSDGDGDVELLCAVGNPGVEGGTIFLWDTPGIPDTIEMAMYQYGPGRDGLYPGISNPPTPIDPTTPDVPPGFDGSLIVSSPRPNPSGVETSIRFSIDEEARVAVRVYDAAGRAVRDLTASEPHAAGTHVLEWDGRDDGGRLVPDGVYLVQVSSRGETATRKVVVAR